MSAILDVAHDVEGPHVLEVRDLRVTTGTGVDIVDDISFTVAAGELVAIVGESGSGKTTVALSLIAHARPGTTIASGVIELGGADLRGLDPKRLRELRGRQVSYVSQDPTASLSPRLRVGAQVREMLDAHGESRQRSLARVHELFESVDLPTTDEFLRRYPFELSGGQQQRVLIAMALAWKPPLVILDEPTTGLDVTTQARVLELLRGLQKESGAAFVYVTHDLAVVDGLADRVLVMYAGRVIESGSRDLVFDAPTHPYTSMLLQAVPRLSVRTELHGREGGAPPPGRRPVGCNFAPRCDRASERCIVEFPPVVEVADGRTYRCWHPIETGLHERVELRQRPLPTAEGESIPAQLLSVVDAVASYGRGAQRHEVLHHVSLAVGARECVALVGQSGSGKSTIGRAIAGLHGLDSGEIRFGRERLEPSALKRSDVQRRAIQIVFQNPERSLNPHQRIANIVGRPLKLFEGLSRRDNRRRVVELLERVRLPASYMDRYPRELSGGEKQRVAIARALTATPQVLVSDEITSALDVSIQATIVELLESLRADGLAILFITHNLALVNSIADRVVVLDAGTVCEEGPTEQVIEHPSDPYTRELLASAPDMR